MLVLTRKTNESVIIDSKIEVKILAVRGDQVSLGFSAPRDVAIYRSEVYEAIQEENEQADHQGKESGDELCATPDKKKSGTPRKPKKK